MTLEDPVPAARRLSIGDDLNGIADALAELLAAPVVIEDDSSRVLAFSEHQEQSDLIRIESILQRRTPEKYVQRDRDRGVLEQLRSADGPRYLPPLEVEGAVTKPRVVAPVRYGDELVGVIWIVADEPPDETARACIMDAALLIAERIVARRELDGGQGSVLDRLLRGDPASERVREEAGLGPGGLRVVAVRDPTGQCVKARLAHGIRIFFQHRLDPIHVEQRAAVVYLVIGAGRDGDLADRLQEFQARRAGAPRLFAGVGTVAVRTRDLAASLRTADAALRTALHADLPFVHAERDAAAVMLRRLQEITEDEGGEPSPAFARLLALDRDRGGALIPTLRAWLERHGDVVGAAEEVHIHPNSLRYRLRRIEAVTGLHLDDAEDRFGLHLELRVFAAGAPVVRSTEEQPR